MKAAAVVLTLLAVVPANARADGVQMTLGEAYQLALRYSERVALARASVTDAEIQQRATWNELTPAIAATGSQSLQPQVVSGGFTFQQDHQLVTAATLQQPVFRKDFFASRSAAEHRRESAAETLVREREQLARDVADTYIDVVRTRAIREIDHAAIDRTVALYENTVGRVKAGGALHTAELLAELDVQRARRQFVSAQRDVGVAEANFLRLVGHSPPANLDMPPLPTVPEHATALKSASERADVKALELEVSQAQEAEAAASGRRWWPKLDVQASLQYLDPGAYGTQNVQWVVTGLVTIPLLQSGTEFTDIALRANEAHVASLELEQQRKIVANEVEVNAVQVATTTQTAELADQQLKTARENYQLVEKQFKLGAITFLEVANAEAALSEAENAFAGARADRVRAVYDYLFAIGALDLGAAAPSP